MRKAFKKHGCTTMLVTESTNRRGVAVTIGGDHYRESLDKVWKANPDMGPAQIDGWWVRPFSTEKGDAIRTTYQKLLDKTPVGKRKLAKKQIADAAKKEVGRQRDLKRFIENFGDNSYGREYIRMVAKHFDETSLLGSLGRLALNNIG